MATSVVLQKVEKRYGSLDVIHVKTSLGVRLPAAGGQ